MDIYDYIEITLSLVSIAIILGLWLYIMHEKENRQKKELQDLEKEYELKRKSDAKIISSLKSRVNNLDFQITELSEEKKTLEAQNKILNEKNISLNKIANDYADLRKFLAQKGLEEILKEKEGVS